MMKMIEETRIDHRQVKGLKKQFQRANVTDFELVSDSIGRALEEADHHPKPEVLSDLGDILDYVAENLERQAQQREIETRTSADWRALEYQYVTKSTYTEPDLRDDLLLEVSTGTVTEAEAQATYDNYTDCKHRFCLNVFEPKHKSQSYCSPECRESEKYAIREFERTSNLYDNGTYLPVSAYKDIRLSQSEHEYRKHVRLFEADSLQLIADEATSKAYGITRATTLADKARRIDSEAFDNGESSEVVSYNVHDLSEREVKSKKLETFLKKVAK
ncbi:hypothetical protein [Gracilibacillus salinarum]|uniref:Uncharacterized protein n=1 Tax=Gracilibacillus salinarum TaxID=2932255 RepID=A0ABY4GQ04_9BACI|nr:hypothetical protein [Gracilibacillus salinarum]UOQ86205.1 hypothetical protein MUN87_04720 [Gracilibacillus salinarum]